MLTIRSHGSQFNLLSQGSSFPPFKRKEKPIRVESMKKILKRASKWKEEKSKMLNLVLSWKNPNFRAEAKDSILWQSTH
jgi:hypothetical protein